MIKVACVGFPVGRKRYFAKLTAVEVSETRERFPRAATLERWRAEAPAGFEFILSAPDRLVNPAPRRAQALARRQPKGSESLVTPTLAAATALASRLVLLSIPGGWPAHPDSVGKLQALMRSLGATETRWLWTPPAFWPATLINSVLKSLGLIPVTNPLARRRDQTPLHKQVNAPVRYHRIGRAAVEGGRPLDTTDFREIRSACDKPLNYVVFDTGPTAFEDAVRFAASIY